MEQPGGNEDQKMREIASIESRKINSSDPSMIWRWKTQLDQQASEAEKNRLASAAASSKISQDDIRNFGYKVDMLVNRTNPANTGDKTRQIIDLENAILEGQKLGADVTRLVEKKKAVENSLIGEDSGDFSGGTTAENLKANVEDFVNSKPSTAQIDEFVKKHTNLGNDEQKMIKAARREAVDREEKEYKAAVLKKAKSLNTSGLDWEDLKEEEQKKLMAKAKAALAK
jgi:1,6-anhydro-N-acetylmuramate kinase